MLEWTPDPSIDGVLRRQTVFNADDRGAFGELWRESWTSTLKLQFRQANLSRSGAGVLRGLHFHRRQTDLWVILEGSAHVAVVDLRERMRDHNFDERPRHSVHVLEAGAAIVIPPGVAHGFWALDQVSLLYLVTHEYDAKDEHGFAWNDPLAGVRWPPGTPILSERDSKAPSMEKAISRAR
jgi:dTDP-4-dehydrorhamnose 3,5-epimerase